MNYNIVRGNPKSVLPNSGLAVGGQLIYEGSDGCNQVWGVDKTSKALALDFSTIISNDPNFRDEDLECDTNSFAAQGEHVMWSKEAYTPMRAHAFEIEFGSCGIGGVQEDLFYMDVKAGSCPNPLNLKEKGVLPIALGKGGGDMEVLEGADLDAFIATLTLELRDGADCTGNVFRIGGRLFCS